MSTESRTEIIANRYRISSDAELGRGGFAVVYKARDTHMERDVALKVIHNVHTDEETFIQRFRQEARTAADLSHPNIVPVYDFGEGEYGTLYLAMALIGQGRTLRDLLNEQAPLSLAEALPILTPLASALDYLCQHDPPLTHRDIKPANVLLAGDAKHPWVVLTDFGLVRSLQASSTLTESGSILGTPAYMAPEQADSKQWGEVCPLADIYALGVMAYEMLAGRPPFEGEMPAVLHAHAYEPPPSPLELRPDLGDDLSDVLLHALRKPPAERYASGEEFVAALQAVSDTRSAAVQREATLEQLEAQAKELLEAGEWLEALDCCTQMVRLDPDRPTTLKMLTTAKQGMDREHAEAMTRRRLMERYQEGLDLLAEERWKQAYAAFEEVAEGNPDFRDVHDRLARTKDELQRAQWYDEAIAYTEAEHWAEACRAWVNVVRERIGYRGGDAAERLLDATEKLLGQFERSRRALDLYEELAMAVEEDDWQQAVDAGEALLQVSPDLPGAQAWMDRARRQFQVADEGAVQKPRGETMTWKPDSKEMVRIPAGEFFYGNNKEKRTLPELWIDKAPVTNAEYARFVNDTGHKAPQHWTGKTPPGKIADHPVTYVSWHDAVAYAEWAGKRLPSEEEWEKAARGTDGREYPWGDHKPTRELCNFDSKKRGTTPVGNYSPQGDSPYGCVDMAGNVWEWTASNYGKNRKVVRGGSWGINAGLVRSALRDWLFPDETNHISGFRCARGSD